jgi:hypothetical protein
VAAQWSSGITRLAGLAAFGTESSLATNF